MRFILLPILSLCFLMGCQKESKEVELTSASLIAYPGNKSIKLNFYLFVYSSTSSPDGWGRVEPNAKFDILETDEHGVEIRTLARQVSSDSFWIEGLDDSNDHYYFKVKAYLGRNFMNESAVVSSSASPLSAPDLWLSLSGFPFSGFYWVLDPTGDFAAVATNNDSLGHVTLYDMKQKTSKLIPIKIPIKLLWNNRGDKLLIHAYAPFVYGAEYSTTQLYIYELDTDSLRLLTPETKRHFLAPHFAPDSDDIQFFSNELNPTSLEMWRMAPDGTGKTRIFTQLPSFPLNGNWDGQLQISWDDAGRFAYISVLEADYANAKIIKFDTSNGSATQLFSNDGWNEHGASVSPNNKNLIFYSNRSGHNDLWSYNFESNRFYHLGSRVGGLIFNTYYGVGWWSDSEFYLSGINSIGAFDYYTLRLP